VNVLLINSKTRPAEARSGVRLVETEVVTANVKVEGEGPPIILIHGFGAALDWWDEIAPQLAQDRKVVRLDLIGHGGTEAPAAGYDIERQASLVKAVLDTLGIGSAVVVGHSMGGEVATAFTENDPDRVERLVLIDSPPTPERSFSLLSPLAFTDVIGQTLWLFRTNAVLRRGLAQGFAPGFAVPEKFVADLWQLTYTAFHEAHDDSIAFTTERGTPARLAGLDPVPPLLVLFGSEDALISPQNAKRFEVVPGAKVVMIDGVGHSPMVEAPAKTLSLIRKFLNEDHRNTEPRQ
jgi:pimeloyl-ACP methyl ester carboxylesterase